MFLQVYFPTMFQLMLIDAILTWRIEFLIFLSLQFNFKILRILFKFLILVKANFKRNLIQITSTINKISHKNLEKWFFLLVKKNYFVQNTNGLCFPKIKSFYNFNCHDVKFGRWGSSNFTCLTANANYSNKQNKTSFLRAVFTLKYNFHFSKSLFYFIVAV